MTEHKRRYMEQWRSENCDRIKAYAVAYRKTHRDRKRETDNAWRKSKGEAWKKHKAEYDRLNKDRINANRRRRYHAGLTYHRTKEYRLRSALRTRLRNAVTGTCGSARTLEILGCSIRELVIYLESKFQTGMSWDNYAKVWEIDHIIPCAVFDLSKADHVKRCFHFSNVQPMFVADNRRKSSRIITNQFNLL
jgi:hypothetical protein